MGRDTIQLENDVSTISHEYLLEFTSEYGIPESLHPELPGPEDPIVEFPEGKVGVYTKFFEFSNFCIPISQFLFDILGHYQIHLSQLSVIDAAKDNSELPKMSAVSWAESYGNPKDYSTYKRNAININTVFDSIEMAWVQLKALKPAYGVFLANSQAITARGSINMLLTNGDVLMFDAYKEKWTRVSSLVPTLDECQFATPMQLVKYAGRFGIAWKPSNASWVIWILTHDQSFKKLHVFIKKEDSERESLQALYDSDTSIMVDHNTLIFHSANSWQWDLHSSGSGNILHWQWELILPVGTLSWQWECLVHFIPNRKRIGFENPSYFEKAKDLRPTLYDEKVIGLDQIDLEDEVVNLLEKEKANLETIESLKSKGFESSENVSFESENQTKNDCLVVEKECDKKENPNVIAPGMFNLNVSQCVSPISMSKSSCDSNNVEIKLKRKRHLDTFSNVRRPKNSGVIWKKKGSSNSSNVGLSAVCVSNLNKNVKRYSRKDLLACNNSHLGETSSAYMCNDAMNVSCDSRMNDLLDDNNFFIFDNESVKISPVSKMPFRKKPFDSMNVCSKRCSKHMTGNRALLTNFVEKFLGTVRFGNNDFAVIAGYGDVVIGSMMIIDSGCLIRDVQSI
nr:F-box associated interaction domain, leucine-rich repeat domain, L domain-like protein [Tanacetum cinerariifolium]